jgi:hypothetical protein
MFQCTTCLQTTVPVVRMSTACNAATGLVGCHNQPKSMMQISVSRFLNRQRKRELEAIWKKLKPRLTSLARHGVLDQF